MVLMQIIINELLLIALVTFPFLIGYFTAIKVMKIKITLSLLKKISPVEFKKLLDDKYEK